MSRAMLRPVLAGVAAALVLVAVLVMARYHVVQCVPHGQCYVLDRWTGHVQARYPQAAEP